MAEYLKIPEVARRLDVSEKTARRYVKAGALPSTFIGGAYRVTEVDLEEFVHRAEVKPEVASPGKASSRSSLEPSLFYGLEDERRGSKLPRVAEMLLNFGEMLLLTWEAELPARASADDDQWLQDIRQMWQAFGLINYGVLEELGADGVRDKEAWLARYMDVNAAVHRINAAIRDNIAAGASPDEEDAVLLKTLVAVK